MKRFMKFAAIVISIALVVGLLWFANAMMGNPVSHALASRAAKEYLAEQFPDSDYHMERITYSFKDGDYHAFMVSPSNIDGDFSVSFSMLGEYRWDTYDSVVNRFNTASRLNMEYRKLTDTILNDPALPYDNTSMHSIMFGELEIYPGEAIDDPTIIDIPEYAIVQDDLELNKIYDIKELGAKAGHLIIYVDNETITVEEAARIMLDFRAMFDNAGIPFYAMDFVLRHPRTENVPIDDEEIRVNDFLYEEIFEEGFTERIEAAISETAAYYAMLDQMK